jgi:hypothetical protein
MVAAVAVLALVATVTTVVLRPGGDDALVDCPDAVIGTGPAPEGRVRLVADLDAVQPREGSARAALLVAADQLGSGEIPRVRYNAEREGDAHRYLYDEGVALRRVAGVLAYAYAVTGDRAHLRRLAQDVARNAARWPDWNPGHPLDAAQVGAAVALAAAWSREELDGTGRTEVQSALVDRLIAPYVCRDGDLHGLRRANGNQATVGAVAVALAGLAIREDRPRWAAQALTAATDVLGRNGTIASGPTVEGLMYSNYEAAWLALLTSTAHVSPEDPDVARLADVLPPLDAMASWTECVGLVAEPDVGDGWSSYPWVDRASGLAAMTRSDAAGPRVRQVLDGLQQEATLTLPTKGTWPVPDGIAELVLATVGAPRDEPAAREVQSRVVPPGPLPRYGGLRSGPTSVVLSGTPNDAAHNHQDVGNVVVSSGEQQVTADLGQRDYNARIDGPNWRAATRSHSTIGLVMPDGTVVQDRRGSGVVDETADGLRMRSRAVPGVRWQRLVTASEGDVRVTDELRTWPGPLTLSMQWLLPVAPSAVTTPSPDVVRYDLPDGSTWELSVSGAVGLVHTDAAPVPPYEDSPEAVSLGAAHTLVTATLHLRTHLDVTTHIREIRAPA